MTAFARAVDLGYRYLETDVHVTADGVLIAFHDATLDRVTDRTGAVAALPWREVRAARIAGVEPIPLLTDILEAWPDARLNIEPKSDRAVDALIGVVSRMRAIDRICVGSFSDRRLRRIRAGLGPRLCTSMSPTEVRRLRLAAWGLLPRATVPRAVDDLASGSRRARRRPMCVQISVRHGRVALAEPRLLACAHALGLPVHIWTVNDPIQMRRLLDLGVDGIMTDDIDALRRVLHERGAWDGPKRGRATGGRHGLVPPDRHG